MADSKLSVTNRLRTRTMVEKPISRASTISSSVQRSPPALHHPEARSVHGPAFVPRPCQRTPSDPVPDAPRRSGSLCISPSWYSFPEPKVVSWAQGKSLPRNLSIKDGRNTSCRLIRGHPRFPGTREWVDPSAPPSSRPRSNSSHARGSLANSSLVVALNGLAISGSLNQWGMRSGHQKRLWVVLNVRAYKPGDGTTSSALFRQNSPFANTPVPQAETHFLRRLQQSGNRAVN